MAKILAKIFGTKKPSVLEKKEENLFWEMLKNLRSDNNKKFFIIIPSYNNKDWYQKNLDSVFMQKYDNYHVIYLDDCSSDGTGDLVEQYIKEKKQEHRVSLIKNKNRMYPLASTYTMMQLCDECAIAVVLDGDDWFAHKHVLELLNKMYANPDVWLTYGQYRSEPPTGASLSKQIPEYIIKNNEFRSYRWVTSHLRTFYVWLFKLINIEDLLVDGAFFHMAGDMAAMFPMLEMAGFRSKFIPDILYVYNRANPLNDDKVNRDLQRKLERIIRSRERYIPLGECPQRVWCEGAENFKLLG